MPNKIPSLNVPRLKNSGRTEEKRTMPINLKYSPREYALVTKLARLEGKTTNRFIRERSLRISEIDRILVDTL